MSAGWHCSSGKCQNLIRCWRSDQRCNMGQEWGAAIPVLHADNRAALHSQANTPTPDWDLAANQTINTNIYTHTHTHIYILFLYFKFPWNDCFPNPTYRKFLISYRHFSLKFTPIDYGMCFVSCPPQSPPCGLLLYCRLWWLKTGTSPCWGICICICICIQTSTIFS